tara:strand:+ start:530 stop:670 length:141 start_codon:yes stop_codon:yes gene_type:complete
VFKKQAFPALDQGSLLNIESSTVFYTDPEIDTIVIKNPEFSGFFIY